MALSKNDKKRALKEEKDWERIDSAIFGSERFIEKNSKQIIIAVVALILLVGGYFAYKHFIQEPKNEEAKAAMFQGELYTTQGRDSLAVYGDGNSFAGFKRIASEYASTDAGRVAKAYTGLCLAKMGKYDEALTYLKDYSSKDEIFQYLVRGAIGDCLVNTGKISDAIPYFLEAAKGLDNVSYSGLYYKKAGLAYMDQKKYDEAIGVFTTIKTRYMNSPEAPEATKFIEQAQLLKGQK